MRTESRGFVPRDRQTTAPAEDDEPVGDDGEGQGDPQLARQEYSGEITWGGRGERKQEDDTDDA